ncbi:MAG: histidine kinase [Gemmatimonadaceae bacterium]|nr:histidine kinase [Gemmatimonadaceae bacterium]
MLSSHALTLADAGVALRRWTRVLFALVWIIPGLLAALQLAYIGDVGEPYSFRHALLWQGAAWLPWGLWSQGILSLVDRVALDTQRLARWLAVHALSMVVVVALTLAWIAWLDLHFAHGGESVSYAFVLRLTTVAHLEFQVVLYWAVVGAAYMWEYVRRYHERDRVANELEQKLARTQLDALRMQLNPHFLFNALNSVTELMEDDVPTAQRTLTRVADLLRLSLRSAGSATIPVWQEVELAELYLQIARVRYGSGLEVDVEVDSSVVDREVPSFLLQPLIENALKHGLAPGQQAQRIHVRLTRVDQHLELIVEDNGRGLDGLITNSGRFLAARPSVDGLGIGLTNTRSRLAMLYGDRYAFRMSNHEGGGCRVEIRLPLDP